nr:ferritin-like domain-containing protein [Campylobacter sp.]
MRLDFFDKVWEIENAVLEDKFNKFEVFFDEFKNNEFDFGVKFSPKPLEKPSYAGFCEVFSMKDLKKPKNADKTAVFLHSVAHIEYSAIDIALDACYRFANMPRDYYFDWLEVAWDEIRHFKMIENELSKFGHKYGDFAVHDGLFVALIKTSQSVLDRMAILPRFMEANGLDANIFIMSKFAVDKEKSKLCKILQIIHDEEINHVKKGDKWFKFSCQKMGVNPNSWINIVQKHYPKAFKTTRKLDLQARLKAGFSQIELENILNLQGQI